MEILQFFRPLVYVRSCRRISAKSTTLHCNILQHTATHYNKLCFRIESGAAMCRGGCCPSALPCVAICCKCVADVLQCGAVWCSVLQCVAVCCRMLPCVAVWCNALQCVAVCCSVLPCVAVCCSVLQCVTCSKRNCSSTHTAMHCNTLQHTATHTCSKRNCSSTNSPQSRIRICSQRHTHTQ